MFMVYWTEVQCEVKTPHQREFGTDEMVLAMKLMEELRTRQRAGEGVCYVAMQSENPNSVGHPGVDTVGSDYSWKKRRR